MFDVLSSITQKLSASKQIFHSFAPRAAAAGSGPEAVPRYKLASDWLRGRQHPHFCQKQPIETELSRKCLDSIKDALKISTSSLVKTAWKLVE